MPKVARELVEAKENLKCCKEIFLCHGFFEDHGGKLREFVALFDKVVDSRIKAMCKYDTKTIVVIVFLALFDERTTWKEIEDFAGDHKDFLKEYVNLDAGIPSHDTFMRVFSLIDSSTLQDTIVNFITQVLSDTINAVNAKSDKPAIIAIDGKEERGSGRKLNTDEKHRNTQILHVFNVSTEHCISSKLISSKSNEIPAAQIILHSINVEGSIVTTDAMNTQKETVKAIRDGKGHYTLALKKNHNNLYEVSEEYFKKNESRIKNTKDYYKMETEKSHSQIETREFFRMPTNELYSADEWEDIESIVMYKKTIENISTNEVKVEKRYYISDLKDVELIADAIRAHWGVENKLHWHLDVNFLEDANSTMDRRALYNLSMLNKAVLNIIKLMAPLFRNGSIKRTLKSFRSHYEENIQKMFKFLDGKEISKIIKNK